jgi:hypothetical protein
MPRRIAVEITGDARSLERAFARSSKSAKKFQGDVDKTASRGRRGFGLLGKAAGLAGGLIGAYGLGRALGAVVDEVAETQKVSAQTAAVLESTGKAANVSAKQVDTLATSLSNMSGVDDEAIASGENMLLTFTNIRNEVGKNNKIFDQATEATLDLSVAMGRDMQQSAVMVGKALNDPVKGVGALRRVGVQFTDAQEDQIKALVKSGRTLDAQRIILRELQKEFGGSARAAGNTLPGALNKLRNVLVNLGATIAQKFTPAIQRTVNQIVKWLQNSQNQKRVLDTVNQIAGAVAATFKTLAGIFRFLNSISGSTKNTLLLLAGVFATLKAVRLGVAIAQVATSVGLVNTALTGPAGLIALAGAAAFVLTTMGLKATGLDEKLRGLGGTLYDLATKFRLFGARDPMKQFEGKRLLTPEMIRSLRGQAMRLRRRGIPPAEELARRHPRLARRDIEVAIGVRRPQVQVTGGLHLHGVQNVPQLEQEIQKRAKGRPHRRRGAR